LALEVMLKYLPPLHERVGALHYLLAAAYQFNAEYELACKHWIAVIHCFDWLPADAPVLREAAHELFVCRTSLVVMKSGTHQGEMPHETSKSTGIACSGSSGYQHFLQSAKHWRFARAISKRSPIDRYGRSTIHGARR
jgi:hypothetical protein